MTRPLLGQWNAWLAGLGRFLGHRRRLIEDRTAFSVGRRQDRQGQAGSHETGGQERRRPGQQIARGAAGHKAAHAAAPAAAHTQRAAFAALKQNDANQGDRQNQMDDKNDCRHEI